MKIVLAPLLFHGLGNVAQELVPSVSSITTVCVSVSLTLIVTMLSWRWINKPVKTKQH